MGAVALAVFAAVSLGLAIVDTRSLRLPDAVVLPALVIGAVLLGAAAQERGEPARMLGAFVGASALFCAHLALHFTRPEAWGGGDVKLAALIGLHLGWIGPDAVVLGAAAGAALLAATGLGARAVSRGGIVPAGPALLAGCWWAVIAVPP